MHMVVYGQKFEKTGPEPKVHESGASWTKKGVQCEKFIPPWAQERACCIIVCLNEFVS